MATIFALTGTLAVVGIASLVLWARLEQKSSTPRDWKDIEFTALALSRLMDPTERQYLRDRIAPRRFRELHRKRMRLAFRYTGRLRLDIAAWAKQCGQQQAVLIQLNELNYLLLRMQTIALASHICPDYGPGVPRFGALWQDFSDRLRPSLPETPRSLT